MSFLGAIIRGVAKHDWPREMLPRSGQGWADMSAKCHHRMPKAG